MRINYKKFIEQNFEVIDKQSLVPVPFKFNKVQNKYYGILESDYKGFEGVREIILKARQEGLSSFILALFAVDFLLRPYSVSICISHRTDSTNILFKKVKSYIDSYFMKLAAQENVGLDVIQKRFLKSDSSNYLENAENKAEFAISTAGSKVGLRGGSARNVLFSEAAFYPDTDILNAREIVTSTTQQVPLGRGMVFIESTANSTGNFYHSEWERSNEVDAEGKSKSAYHPRFFGWRELYSQEFIDEKSREFPDEKTRMQEYPDTPDEAFISSGTPYFDNLMLDAMLKQRPPVKYYGKFAPNGEWI